VTSSGKNTNRDITAPRSVAPQRASPNRSIARPRRSAQRSLIAYGDVVHIGVADRVLSKQGLVAYGGGLIAFDVRLKGKTAKRCVKSACGVALKSRPTKGNVVAARGISLHSKGTNRSII
jgi:hypothetical protein